MYVPAHFAASAEETSRLLAEHVVADLIVATSEGLVANFLPFVFDPQPGALGALLGHVARANDLWRREFLGEALVIAHGPDAYVSPSWYESKLEHGRVVPTWNYLTAHVYGELVVHDEATWKEALVRRLTQQHESSRAEPWSVEDAPRDFIDAQLRAIVGIELRISRIEAKAKWSQNRSENDRRGVERGLLADGRLDAAANMRGAPPAG